ncbi:unnamed protein product [Tilletia laevis]|uniref:Uncharacterized protein n=3 Tax=Tilletia TaxID=13289 RepID=A0A8X7MQL2_9BASI|nr:hypothetical protein CF328_g5151 [Tilletia controversa]KAE8197681.1 hypothetical protein CF336_g2041 [Tilletia laevis]KAE8258824.1 hypothetical protein A4X03_0g4268 [Tilletia caries]KAE8243952.1 hypothetical protein A4X06_0g6040 [Tilletia controversa]CAD6907296.1 unnamed protein product [Tilletia laevis]
MICPRLILLLLPILLFKITASTPLPKPAWALSPSGLQDRSGPPIAPEPDLLRDMFFSHVGDLDRAMDEAARAGLYFSRHLTAEQQERIARALAMARQAREGMRRVAEVAESFERLQ